MKKIICMLLFFVSFYVHGQEIILDELTALPPVEVFMPIAIDSVNQKNKKFGMEDLLKLPVSIPKQESFTTIYKADTNQFIYPQVIDKKLSMQLFSFYIQANKYEKAELKVTSPNLLEIYVDGKLKETKRTSENSVSSAKEITTECIPYPLYNRILIKLLAEKGKESALKIQLNNIPADSTEMSLNIVNHSTRNIVLDDMIKGKRISNLSFSPNGNYYLISYINNHGSTSSYSTELCHVKTNRRILIDTDRKKMQLQWMPKTEKLYYLQRDGKESNLITINPETLQENIWIENVPYEYFIPAPNEKIFFYSKTEEKATNNDPVFRVQNLRERIAGDVAHSFIYQFEPHTGQTRQLTFGSHTTFINDISPDSRSILFSITDDTETERPFRTSSLYLLHTETMQVDTLWENEIYLYSAIFSPDGKRILILGAPEAFGGIGLNVEPDCIANSYDRQAYIMDLATKKLDPISKDFNPSMQHAYWNKHDGLIYFQVIDEDYVRLYTYQSATRKFTLLPLTEETINNFSIAKQAPAMLYYGTSTSNSTRAYIYGLKNQKSQLVADPYANQLKQYKLGDVKDWTFTNSAGTTIKGRYYLPPNFDSSRKYPMIVYYYGGTTPSDRRFESRYPMHVYAAMGYVVYVIQPSGAIGFGQKFSSLHVNTWGNRSSDDIIEGTKQFLQEHPFINEKKIGCMGASYGGFMTMYLQTRTDLFATAVSHAGISSISSYWGEGYWGYTYSAAASAHSYPWNNHELYVKQSPLFQADKINTPLLLLHGMSDTNVPLGESVQMFTALKILGKPVELIQVKGEDHHIVNYEKRKKWNEYIFAWFDKWLKDEPAWWDDINKEK